MDSSQFTIVSTSGIVHAFLLICEYNVIKLK